MPQAQISLSTVVVVPDQQTSAELPQERVVLNLEDGVYYGFSGVGGRIWELAGQPTTVQKILETLIHEYEVDEARCRSELLGFLLEIHGKGLLEIRNGSSS